MMASTCPYCGAETRPGDNFCLNCGNRLTPSSQPQAQPVVGEATLPAQDGWTPSVQDQGSTPVSSGANWSDTAAPTISSSGFEPPTAFGTNATQSAGQATSIASATIEHPARFILRADNGEVLQEYVLEKPEISIGRAPNSDILLSKDKLTSRRHATVTYENGKYILHDERSANGTFVNGQQLDEMATHVLQDGDHVGIGEHELIFRGFGSSASAAALADNNLSEMPTIAVQFNPDQELTYRTQEDQLATAAAGDDFSTNSMDNGTAEAVQLPANPPEPATPAAKVVSPSPALAEIEAVPGVLEVARPAVAQTPSSPASPVPSTPPQDIGITFSSLTNIPLMAALSTLDGQVMSLQEQLNATQDAVRNHETEVAQAANQLRTGVRRVSDRMNNTIADVARSREALSWAELTQLMEDVQNNPRDIEYVTKLARRARELNKVFQMHQNVLNTLAECNSLLRGLIGEDK